MWSLNFYMCQNHHDLIFISFSEMLLFIVYFQEPFPPWINPFFFKFCPPILELRPHEQVTESMNNEKRHLLCNAHGRQPCSLLFIVCWVKTPMPSGKSPDRDSVGLGTMPRTDSHSGAQLSHTFPFVGREQSETCGKGTLGELGKQYENQQGRKRVGMPGAGKIMSWSSSWIEALSSWWTVPTLHFDMSFVAWKRHLTVIRNSKYGPASIIEIKKW